MCPSRDYKFMADLVIPVSRKVTIGGKQYPNFKIIQGIFYNKKCA